MREKSQARPCLFSTSICSPPCETVSAVSHLEGCGTGATVCTCVHGCGWSLSLSGQKSYLFGLELAVFRIVCVCVYTHTCVCLQVHNPVFLHKFSSPGSSAWLRRWLGHEPCHSLTGFALPRRSSQPCSFQLMEGLPIDPLQLSGAYRPGSWQNTLICQDGCIIPKIVGSLKVVPGKLLSQTHFSRFRATPV